MDNLPVREYPPWKEGVKRFLARGYKHNDVIQHREMWEMLEMEYPDKEKITASEWDELRLKFMSQFCQMREMLLLEHNVHLDTAIGIGYRILPPEEQTPNAVKDMRNELAKLLHKTGNRLACTEFDLLTEEQKQANMQAGIKLGMLKQAATIASRRHRLQGPKLDEAG